MTQKNFVLLKNFQIAMLPCYRGFSLSAILLTVHNVCYRTKKNFIYDLANSPQDAGQNQQAIHRQPSQQSTICSGEPTSSPNTALPSVHKMKDRTNSPRTALPTVHKMQGRTNNQSTDGLAISPQEEGQNQ